MALYGFFARSRAHVCSVACRKSAASARRFHSRCSSGVSTDEFARLVQLGDVASLTRIPGIGKKTAERIVVELRDRVDGDARCRLSGRRRRGAEGSALPKRPSRCSSSATSRPKSSRLGAGCRRARRPCRRDHPQGAQGRIALTRDDRHAATPPARLRRRYRARFCGAGAWCDRRGLRRHRHQPAVRDASRRSARTACRRRRRATCSACSR